MNALRIKTDVDQHFARFLAASARELKRDPKLSPMGAFDTLQRINRKYEDRWLVIWIVCSDGFADVTPSTPLQAAIDRIEQHGGAAGIIGVTILGRSVAFLKKQLRPGKDVMQLLDACGNAAADRFLEIAGSLATLKNLAIGEQQ
jgi:hypothetical protein